MAEILRSLREEHQNMARLLSALEHQLALFDRAERPDYDVLSGIADYFASFPARVHHPKEDLILRRLRRRDAEAADAVGDLESEHAALDQRVRQFRQAVGRVIAEAEMPREAFTAALRNFIDDQRAHMEMENQSFFPAAMASLTEADWAALDAEASKEQDPLFGPEVAEEFADLSDTILQWEQENLAAGS